MTDAPLDLDLVLEELDMPARSIKPGKPNKHAARKTGLSMGYVEWMDTVGFYAKETWDNERQEWAGEGKIKLFPLQRRILGHALQTDERGRFIYTTVLYSTIKKDGKTSIAASIGAWYAECCPPGTEIYIIANTQEQAEGRVMRDLKFHVEHTVPGAKVEQYRIIYPNGTIVYALAQHYQAVAGSRHALTLWDELWGYQNERGLRMWAEMTPIPTEPNSLRVVTTYAGYEGESTLLEDLYKRGVGKDEHKEGKGQPIPDLGDLPCWKNGRMFTYWDHVANMPWNTEQYLDEQQVDLRPADYLRLHCNMWVTSAEIFIPKEWWERAAKYHERSAELWREHPYRSFPIHLGIDVAPKHDSSAVWGTTYDPKRGKVVVVFGRIWVPVEGQPFDLEATVEDYIEKMSARFKIVSGHYDPSQFHRSMVTLTKKGIKLEEFTQSEGNMIAATQNLFDLFKTDALEAYPDDDLGQHVKNAVAKMTPRGQRIVKDMSTRTTMRKKVDGAVALAIAAYHSVSGAGFNMETITVEMPFADTAKWATSSKQDFLPAPLRG